MLIFSICDSFLKITGILPSLVKKGSDARAEQTGQSDAGGRGRDAGAWAGRWARAEQTRERGRGAERANQTRERERDAGRERNRRADQTRGRGTSARAGGSGAGTTPVAEPRFLIGRFPMRPPL